MTTLQILSLLAEHLEGLRVGHDFNDIEEGEGMILTIKDKGVLDEDGNNAILTLPLTLCR